MIPAPVDLDTIDLADMGFWMRPIEEREGAFLTLRREDPLRHFDEPRYPGSPEGRGFYAVVRYEDVQRVSRNPDLFCSGNGSGIADVTPELNEFLGSIIAMDDPRHARLRRIVSRAFTPQHLRGILDQVQVACSQIVDGVAEEGGCDFVTDIAAPLPLRIIMNMLGIPRSEEQFVVERTNKIIGFADPEISNGDPEEFFSACRDLSQIVHELVSYRAKSPGDDLVSVLMKADIDGEKLTAEELGSFFILLVVAGNETTRNALTHSILGLEAFPEQRRLWFEDFDGLTATAVEELLRWASPILHMRRTVTRDGVELAGHRLLEGEKVVMWYGSANRDESVFERPFELDLAREPNPHVVFGGPGPHFCLGAHLARREVTCMLSTLFHRLPDIRPAGEPKRLWSNLVNGVRHLDVTFTASQVRQD